MSTIEAYEEVCAEIYEWEDELTLALVDLSNLNKSVACVCAMHELSYAERAWIRDRRHEIYERIDCAELQIAELKNEAKDYERELGLR